MICAYTVNAYDPELVVLECDMKIQIGALVGKVPYLRLAGVQGDTRKQPAVDRFYTVMIFVTHDRVFCFINYIILEHESTLIEMREFGKLFFKSFDQQCARKSSH